MKVRFLRSRDKNGNYPDLTDGNVYRVLGIEADDFRIIGDEGLPYLYPENLFEVIDSSRPKTWQIEFGEEGEEYAYPVELSRPGFFEDLFNDEQKTRKIFRSYMSNLVRGVFQLHSKKL